MNGGWAGADICTCTTAVARPARPVEHGLLPKSTPRNGWEKTHATDGDTSRRRHSRPGPLVGTDRRPRTGSGISSTSRSMTTVAAYSPRFDSTTNTFPNAPAPSTCTDHRSSQDPRNSSTRLTPRHPMDCRPGRSSLRAGHPTPGTTSAGTSGPIPHTSNDILRKAAVSMYEPSTNRNCHSDPMLEPARQPPTDEHPTLHHLARRQRLRDRIRAERHSSHLPQESNHLIRLAQSWIPYGGPPADEVMVQFGMTTARFLDALRQTINQSDCDPSIARRIHTAYFTRPTTR